MKRLIILLFVLLINFNGAFAEEKQKVLTRGEVIDKISASDFLKRKIGDLLNWGVGYDITKINRTNLAPTISFIKAAPVKAPPDNRTLVLITARVTDPSGPDNIRGVRADLSDIKKLPNTMLVDNGLWGDSAAGDGIYSLQTSIGYDVSRGTKDIPVAVSNKMGWVALGKTNLDVEINPVISDTRATPPATASDGRTVVKLTAGIINPGRREDLKDVTIDLRSVGLGDNVKMWDDGSNSDAAAEDGIFTVSVSVKEGISKGQKRLPVRATNVFGGSAEGEILLMVE